MVTVTRLTTLGLSSTVVLVPNPETTLLFTLIRNLVLTPTA